MTNNPFYNALLAVAYIAGVVSLVFFAPVVFGKVESIFIPMGMLSLLVLSVTVMAYLFFYRPVLMLLDGQREKAVKLFLHTVALFATTTVLIFIIAVAVSKIK